MTDSAAPLRNPTMAELRAELDDSPELLTFDAWVRADIDNSPDTDRLWYRWIDELSDAQATNALGT